MAMAMVLIGPHRVPDHALRRGQERRGAGATVEESVLASVQAWSADDPSARLGLLERSWADDGVYQDPRNRAEGRQERTGPVRPRTHAARSPG